MTVVSCIRDATLRAPTATALRWLPSTSIETGADHGIQDLSYEEIWASALGIATALGRLAQGEAGSGGDAVGLLIDEGTALPLMMLAVLLARMVILPLDPEDPAERLGKALSDARPRILVAKDEIQRAKAIRAAALTRDLAPTIVLSGCNSAINPVTIILVGLGEWDFKDKQTQLELVMMQVGKLFNFAIFALT